MMHTATVGTKHPRRNRGINTAHKGSKLLSLVWRRRFSSIRNVRIGKPKIIKMGHIALLGWSQRQRGRHKRKHVNHMGMKKEYTGNVPGFTISTVTRTARANRDAKNAKIATIHAVALSVLNSTNPSIQ
mmetsp:Transcript_15304/g.28902  ORF Transcript_15304/g.28902 Transcript_15304/m.28902 type:complete len:129 (+) Transcript_15304:510-896(+)